MEVITQLAQTLIMRGHKLTITFEDVEKHQNKMLCGISCDEGGASAFGLNVNFLMPTDKVQGDMMLEKGLRALVKRSYEREGKK